MAKILVGDDDSDIRELFETLLKINNHEVVLAASKKEVLKALETFTPELILLDVMFGIDDGRELCKGIKTTNKSVKIILLSANPALLKTHIECDVDAAIEKPFGAKSLLTLIDTFSAIV